VKGQWRAVDGSVAGDGGSNRLGGFVPAVSHTPNAEAEERALSSVRSRLAREHIKWKCQRGRAM
jgi:hypothetical protein